MDETSTPASRVNGTFNGEQTIGETKKISIDIANNKETAKIKDEDKSKPVIDSVSKAPTSSNLKCLDDPNFSFDEAPSSSGLPAPTPVTASQLESKPQESSTQPTRKPSYRVLEDPELELPKPPKSAGYKVLEDPMMTSIYEPARPEPAKGRPEEVADGARQQFDKFFKGNQNN